MLTALVAVVRSVLVPIIVLTSAFLALLAVHILAGHLGRAWAQARSRRLAGLYRPLISALADERRSADAAQALCRAPSRHRPIITIELVALLGLTSGTVVERARRVADELGLLGRWRRGLAHRYWWRRAESARGLGCVRETTVVPDLVRLLNDPHEEVRAAAVEALGLIGDTRAIPPLVSGFSDGPRLQRARVVLALRAFGRPVVAPLLEHGQAHPEDTATVADLLGLIGGSSALDALTAWSADLRPDVRAAALRALGTLGPCDRTYYYALRGLGDEAAEVRAMAARAVARSLRADAAPYLADTLDDEWEVAAEGARGLRDLRDAGRPWLERARNGPAGDLARQMVWEIDRRAPRPAV